jgi:hypothetical protein
VSNRVAVIALGAVLTGLLVGVVIASSGDDGGSKSTDTAPPDLTVPGGSAGTLTDTKTDSNRTRTKEGTTGGDSSTPGTDQSGGAAAPPSEPDTGGAGAAPDEPQGGSQQNDQPSSGGSPAPKFDEFCKQNPSAC